VIRVAPLFGGMDFQIMRSAPVVGGQGVKSNTRSCSSAFGSSAESVDASRGPAFVDESGDMITQEDRKGIDVGCWSILAPGRPSFPLRAAGAGLTTRQGNLARPIPPEDAGRSGVAWTGIDHLGHLQSSS
jgi:hypothetical protein